MNKQILNCLAGLSSLFLLLSAVGCKSTAQPQKPETPVAAPAEKPQVHQRSAPAERKQKVAVGNQLGGARQGVNLGLRTTVSTVAGKAGNAGSQDGVGTQALFDSPKGITTDGLSLFIADSSNHTIRKIDLASGAVSTLAGSPGKKGHQDGKGSVARFNRPVGITMDGDTLYVTDSNNHTIRKVDVDSGQVTTIAGIPGEVGYSDGSAKRARFFIPEGITTDGEYLYISDTHNHSIRKLSLDNLAVSTVAGLSGAPGYGDDIAGKSRFSYPKGITTDGSYLYVADFGNHQIRRIGIKSGTVTTLSTGGNTTETPNFNYPTGITSDGKNLYVADTFNRSIRKIVIASGVVSNLAGDMEKEGAVDGTGTEAHFVDPVGITTDGSVLYITDSTSHTVRKLR